MLYGREPEISRDVLIYLAADSQNLAKRPPRPDGSGRNRKNRDQHYGAEKRETAGAGTRAGKNKPQVQTKKPRMVGENLVQKRENCERVDASSEDKTASQRERPRPKKGAGAPLPSSTYRADSGALLIHRADGAAMLA